MKMELMLVRSLTKLKLDILTEVKTILQNTLMKIM